MEKKVEYCCGLHEICEKGLSPQPGEKAEYYDDEELDIFKQRTSDSYNFDETAQFREVLETMYASDVPGWLQSLKLRGIMLPNELKDVLPLPPPAGDRRCTYPSGEDIQYKSSQFIIHNS